MQSGILGLGHYVPAATDVLGVSRPVEREAIGASTLAARAVPAALQQAQSSIGDIDFLIFATWTPDVTFPGSGCFLQDQLGCDTIGALDIRAQCAGFLFGLSIADQFVRTGVYKRVLLAGAEVHSAGLDHSERNAAVTRLFGDGAGVALIGPSTDGAAVRAVAIHTDGRRHRDFWCEHPASRQHPVRMTAENFRAGKHFPALAVDSVRAFGIEVLPAVIGEALQAAGCTNNDIDHYVIAHLLPEVAEDTARALGIGSTRLSNPAAAHGHLAAAALPVALSAAVAAGKIGKRSTVCLAACGAGFAWGAAVLVL